MKTFVSPIIKLILLSLFLVNSIINFAQSNPELTCPPDAFIECGEETDPFLNPELGTPSVSVGCGEFPIFEFSDELVNNECPAFILRTWTVLGDCSQAPTCIQRITLNDSEPPTFSIEDINIDCKTNDEQRIEAINQTLLDFQQTIRDNCSPTISINVFFDPAEPFDPVPCENGIIARKTITVEVEDVCGNIASASFDANIIDPTPPIITSPDPTPLVLDCTDPNKEQRILDYVNAITATDDCSGVDRTETTFDLESLLEPTSTCGTEQSQTFSFSAFDLCGNARSSEFTIIIVDNLPPVVTCPAPITVEFDDDPFAIFAAFEDQVTVEDCTDDFEINIDGSFVESGNCPNFAEYQLVVSVSSGCSEEAPINCNSTITFTDFTAPDITCPTPLEVDCTDPLLDEKLSDFLNGASTFDLVDPSGIITNNFDENNFSLDCGLGEQLVTFTATDFCGNSASCSALLTINPRAPFFVCPEDRVVDCKEDIVAEGLIIISFCNISTESETSSPVLIEGQDGCPGARYQIDYTVTDECSQTASCEQFFIIKNDGPVISSCPADQVVTCEEDIIVDPGAVIVDSPCPINQGVYVTNPLIDGIPGCDGTTYTYTYRVIDECGNRTECQQIFTLNNQAPVIEVPAGTTVSCFEEIEVSVNDAVIIGGCDSEINVDLLPPVIEGPKDCPGTQYIFTYRAKDACGRITEVNRIFVNEENETPSIIAPIDITCECLAGINPNPEHAIVSTACGNQDFEITVSDPMITGELDCPGTTYSFIYTLTDACGRSASDVQIFTVENEGPIIACPDTYLQLNCEDYGTSGVLEIIDAWIASVTATSSCGVYLEVFNDFDPANLSTCMDNPFNEVNFFATDVCGRTTTCTGTIVVVDTEGPIFYAEAQDEYVACDNYLSLFEEWLLLNGNAEAVDECATNITWSTIPVNPSIECGESSTVTFVATDPCGNSNVSSATFHALDNSHAKSREHSDSTSLGIGFKVSQNKPNPFSQETQIIFHLTESQLVRLNIYDISGKLIKKEQKLFEAGTHTWLIKSTDLGKAGMYLYQISTNHHTATRKMILVN